VEQVWYRQQQQQHRHDKCQRQQHDQCQ